MNSAFDQLRIQFSDYKAMLIFLAFYSAFLHFFFNFVLMRSKLFKERVKTAKISPERWVRVFPDNGAGYRLYDPLREVELGRILFDPDNNWIYDGDVLNVYEQEDI